ncbi:long-chain-fatty-acid--CoA ligase [Schlesneria paludicola]|uniref:long-chain-fatty-acid--CoA ligase n=1 Tax=Schlesneria paludicola TaxID=360056 RepID=UPI00029B37BD|nr:long-chain fatty acid--CoA ligase [Schlesneria paludicola]
MSIAFNAKGFTGESTTAAWLSHYPACTPTHLEYPDRPVWSLLEESANQFPRRIAIRYFNEQITYEELYDKVRRAAALFQSLGVKPGDRVGILLPNVPEYLIAAYGIWMAGGLVVSLSPMGAAVELDDLLEATDCKLVVTLDLLAHLVTHGRHRPERLLTCSIAPRLPRLQKLLYKIASLKANGLSFGVPSSEFLHSVSHTGPIETPVETNSHDPAYILPTGGTTGRAKAVTLSHANLMANALQLKAWCGNRTGRDTFLAVIPFFHSYGLSTCVTNGIAMAATLVLHHRFYPELTLDLIESSRPTVFPTVPAMLHVMNQHLKTAKRKRELGSLMWVISGGAPLMEETATEFAEHTGAKVVEGFGLSECSPVTHAGPLDGTARIGTIGLPLPDTEALIVDAETGAEILEPGEVGELIIRGPQVMLGYWNNPAATEQILRDGWLYTGDLATQDDEGFFKIVDRKKDLIITSGFNVYPTDVEFVLKKFPEVKDAAVIGVTDPQRGEIVKAIVAVNDKSKFHLHRFEAFIKENLAHHKVPKIIELVEGDLPRNFLGKVLRRKLRETS